MRTFKQKLFPTGLRIALILLGFSAAAVLASGEATDDWQDIWSLTETVHMGIRLAPPLENETAPPQWNMKVGVDRGPLVAGTFTIQAWARSTDTTMPLKRIRFLVGDDDNENGVMDASEWTVVAEANAIQNGGEWSAQAPSVVVSAYKDAYRLEHIWEVDGEDFVSHEDVINENLCHYGAGD